MVLATMCGCFSPEEQVSASSSSGQATSGTVSTTGENSGGSTAATATSVGTSESGAGASDGAGSTEGVESAATGDGESTAEGGDTEMGQEDCSNDASLCGNVEECVAGVCVQVPDGMVPVPAGEFRMGCVQEVVGNCNEDELPVHDVFLDSFAISRTEVSQGEYDSCVSAGECPAPGGMTSYGTQCESPISGAEFPVVCVSWFSARNYCEFIGARLPTEAEWEKAARGTEAATYPWGDGPADCNLAHYTDCEPNTFEPSLSNPGGASPYGALNMSGNVFEWVSDWYGATYYASSPAKNPQGPVSGSRRLTRSQANNYIGTFMRASFRGPDYEAPDPEFGASHVGIRCAVDL